jgi:hypothetical protein
LRDRFIQSTADYNATAFCLVNLAMSLAKQINSYLSLQKLNVNDEILGVSFEKKF